jgi:nitrogenase iron protein NifH
MTNHIALYGKGGVGKTTLATNISAALVESGFSVLLVGCDPDGESSTLLHDGRTEPGLLQQLQKHKAITLEEVTHVGFKGVRCVELGAPGSLGASAVVETAEGLKTFKQLLVVEQTSPDYVLYDISGDSSSTTLRTVISEVEINRLFVVTTADFKALQVANNAFEFLAQYNGESSLPTLMGGLILNNISNSFEEAFANNFAYHTNAKIIGKVPRSLVVKQCELYGKTVIESRPQSNQSYYYRRLANQIVDASGAVYSGNPPRPMSSARLRDWRVEWADQIYALENGMVSDGAAI